MKRPRFDTVITELSALSWLIKKIMPYVYCRYYFMKMHVFPDDERTSAIKPSTRCLFAVSTCKNVRAYLPTRRKSLLHKVTQHKR